MLITAINMFGGFAVTQRMLECSVNEGTDMNLSANMLPMAYVLAMILFILALGGLSNQETARRGNCYGIIGMAIALVATIAVDGHRPLRLSWAARWRWAA